MKTIKTLSIMLFFVLAIATTSCKKDKTGTGTDTGKTGTYTVNGTSYTGKTTIQTFTNGNYSILCQQDEPFQLLQVTFFNKAEAEAGGTIDVANYSASVKTGTVEVTVDGFYGKSSGSRIINVTNKKIDISNLIISKLPDGAAPLATINGNVNF